MTNWRQLTYASVEAGRGRPGGWGVVSTSPGLSPEATEQLLSGVVTRIDEVKPTGDFATREDLKKRARCLAYAASSNGGLWWHAVVAGKDATGRPGNVFTHAVSAENLTQGFRPVDVWDSPDWLMPFGPSEVASVGVGEAIRIRSRRELGIDFARARPREQVECVLSAVAFCFEENKPLVLASSSIEHYVDWLTAVSFLTSAAVARMLPFVTFTRAELITHRPRNFELIGLPHEDLDKALEMVAVKHHVGLVLDLGNLPAGGNDGSWQFGNQQWSSGTFWQDSFFRLANGTRDEAFALVASMDQITADLDPREVLHPEWPLTLALLKRDGLKHEDSARAIKEWNRRQSLNSITDPDLLGLLASHMSAPSRSTAVPDSKSGASHIVNEAPFGESDLGDLAIRETAPINTREVEDLQNSFSSTLRKLNIAVSGDNYPGFAAWHKKWLSESPLCLALESSSEAQRKLAADAILLSLGIPPVAAATSKDREFVVSLTNAGELFPDRVLDLMERWLERSEQARAFESGTGAN